MTLFSGVGVTYTAGSSLSCNVNVLGHHDPGVNLDDAAYVKDDDSVGLRDGITKGSRAGITVAQDKSQKRS